MQDTYVGDIGDFGKFTLLEHLAGSGKLRVGVVWHFVETAGKAKDGRHRDYLQDSDPHMVRGCNSALFEEFVTRGFARHEGHTVSMLEEIYPRYVYFSDHCHANPTSSFIGRKDWIARARQKMRDADFVFFDPDNGISSGNRRAGRKHIHIEELKTFWVDGKSLLIYHHLSRTNNHKEQIKDVEELLTAKLAAEEVHSFHFRRGTGRAYFLLVQKHHHKHFKEVIKNAKCATVSLGETLAGWRSHPNSPDSP